MNLRALSDTQLLQAASDAAAAVRAEQARTIPPVNLATLLVRRDALAAEVARRQLGEASPDRSPAFAVAKADPWWLFHCPRYDDPIKAALVAFKRARAAGAAQDVLDTLEAELNRLKQVRQAAILEARES
ncbi:hypothetical protein [Muricoccus vinaceus]|uniref:Uncharacterized protein n=1 Tax=Muricoccus vinaceus TaxID=424704 RepID=A0ABV6IM41_9PROT